MNTNTPPASPKPGDSYVQSFARGLEVIRSFSATAPQQTLSEVAAQTGLTRAGRAAHPAHAADAGLCGK
jgi:IclR family pca regulon transcriptional regulator